MKCTSCNREINDSARFCRYCGSQVQAVKAAQAATGATCPSCKKEIASSAKFCKYCGAAIESAEAMNVVTQPTAAKLGENAEVLANYITWHILPGQLAVKIDENDIAAYKTIKGVYIAPGTKALFFVNGKFVASLDSGKYAFKEFGYENEEDAPKEPKKRTVWGFFKNIANHIANGVSALFGRNRAATHDEQGNKNFYTVVLVRGADFPLVYDLDKVATKGLRTDIGIHILCKLTNLNDFFEAQLTDKKMVSIKSFAESLLPSMRTVINQTFAMVAPQDVDYNAELFERVLNGLRTSFKEIYPYLSVLSVISLTAKREELEQIRAMKEELYIAELELEQLQLRNDYLNRLQSVEHSNELRMAREDVDFHALMDKIDEERLLNEDKRAEFEQMLKAQALIREARTAVDVEVAINKLKQTALLSEEELQKLKNDVDHRLAMQEASQGHELAMATLQNDVVYEREKLNWNLERQKKEFDAALEEARERAAFGDERREADFDFQKREDQHDLDILKQMQAMREEALKSQHAREMEEKRLESETSIEHHRINATMSFEQIMASNPDISPEAAQALAEKFKAEAASAQNDKTVELTRQHSEDLKAIMEQQMALTRDIVHAQNQANANAVAAKQAELDRVHGDSERNQDRFLSGMQTTITAVADATKPTVAPVTQPTNPKTSETFVFCPNCGKKHGPETLICDACGTSL